MDNSAFKTSTVEIKGKTKNGKARVIKYDRSFLSRIIQNPKAKGFYNDFKNYLLTFDRVKARLGWNSESFVAGPDVVVRLIVRSDALCALFAISPARYDVKQCPHRDYSDYKEFKSTPFFVPIRTAAECKTAKSLAEEMFTVRSIRPMDFPARTDYLSALPMQKDEVLIKKGFIKRSEVEMSEADAKAALATALREEAEEQKELEGLTSAKPASKKKKGTGKKIEEVDFELVEQDGAFELSRNGYLVGVHYDRSFLSRIIQNETVKAYYSEIKNYALSFKIKSRVSWRAERFYLGRVPFFLVKVKGKTMYLYLALDPNNYEKRIYHHEDVSSKKNYKDTPMMIRIKSGLGLRRAKSLIAELLIANGRKEKPRDWVDYVALYPFEDTESLIERNLVKRVEYPLASPGLTLDGEPEEVDFMLEDEATDQEQDGALEQTDCIEEADFELADESEPEEVEFEAEEEPEEVEFDAEDEAEEVDFELDEDDLEEVDFALAEEGDDVDEVDFELVDGEGAMASYGAVVEDDRYVTLKKYLRGFAAKMKQGNEERKDRYAEIKAKILSYKGVKLFESFAGDTFKKGARTLMKSRIRGKTLCLFFALNVDNYKNTVYHHQYKGDVKAYAATPMMIRVKSEQGMDRAITLVEEMAFNYLLQPDRVVPFEEILGTYAYEDTDSLVQKGLIKTEFVTVTRFEAEALLHPKKD